MTISIPFLSALRAYFWGKAASKHELQQAAAPKVEDGLVKLSRMLVVVCQRAGTARGIKMMATEVGQNKIVFRSSLPVLEGEMLRVEMLIQGHGTIRATSKVEWVLSSNGSYTGQLTLWTTPEQRQALKDFVARQTQDSR